MLDILRKSTNFSDISFRKGIEVRGFRKKVITYNAEGILKEIL